MLYSEIIAVFSNRYTIEMQIRYVDKTKFLMLNLVESRGGAVVWGTALQARKSRVRFPMLSWALWLTQPLTELSTGNISWGVKAAGADCLEIWKPQPPRTLRADPGL